MNPTAIMLDEPCIDWIGERLAAWTADARMFNELNRGDQMQAAKGGDFMPVEYRPLDETYLLVLGYTYNYRNATLDVRTMIWRVTDSVAAEALTDEERNQILASPGPGVALETPVSSNPRWSYVEAEPAPPAPYEFDRELTEQAMVMLGGVVPQLTPFSRTYDFTVNCFNIALG